MSGWVTCFSCVDDRSTVVPACIMCGGLGRILPLPAPPAQRPNAEEPATPTVSQKAFKEGCEGGETVSGKLFLVCGGRDYSDRDMVDFTLEAAVLHGPGIRKIICGYDPKSPKWQGADQIAYEWAKANEVPVEPFPAAWALFGRSAGPRRNSEMAAQKPDICLAFPGGDGTADMVAKAFRAGAEIVRGGREVERSDEQTEWDKSRAAPSQPSKLTLPEEAEGR